jgi:predicted dienelactone hydrolase
MMKKIRRRFLCPLALFSLSAWAQAGASNQPYDPLAISSKESVHTVDLTVHDTVRKRDIPIRVYLPQENTPAPVVLFSHGLGGSREGNAFMGYHWAARGYISVFIQHPGSDTGVWQDKPLGQRMEALRRAASIENFLLRVKDVPAVLEQLGIWNKTDGHVLAGRMDLTRVGMSGHSFGAVTTEAVSGQTTAGGLVSFTDPRIRAAIAFSPSSPRLADPKRAFGQVRIPWMLMTGTRDAALIGDADLESRLTVFPALPPGSKYELVLYNAEHSAFTDRALPGDKVPRNPNHHKVILALSTAFWDAYLRNDPKAKIWLDGNGPSSIIEKKDQWQKK